MQERPNKGSEINPPVELGNVEFRGIEVPQYVDHWADTPFTTHVEDDPAYKPFSFALRPGPDDNIHIRYGVLVSQINRFKIEDGEVVYQAGLTDPEIHVPEVFQGEDGTRYSFVELPWRGDVYLYWETDCSGNVTLCDIRGPEKPASVSLPNDTGGKFSVKLGNVTDYEIPALEQDISSDVYWLSAFEGSCDSSSSSSDSDSSPSESSSTGSSTSSETSTSVSVSGSEKSTAIVPMDWHDEGYGALYAVEANEVLFEFVVRDVPITGSTTHSRIDDRFLQVCAPNTLTIAGAPCGDRPGSVGATVIDNEVVLKAWPLKSLRPTKVTYKLTGIRKGFTHLDMAPHTKADFLANEAFLNSARVKK